MITVMESNQQQRRLDPANWIISALTFEVLFFIDLRMVFLVYYYYYYYYYYY